MRTMTVLQEIAYLDQTARALCAGTLYTGEGYCDECRAEAVNMLQWHYDDNTARAAL